MKKLHATVGALALAAGALSVVLGTAASATPACVADVRANTTGVTLTAGGKATPTADGLKMEVAAQADAVNWRRDLAEAVPLKSVTELSYRTRRLDGSTAPAALPSFKLYLGMLDGASETATLVYEPYYQTGVGNPPSGNTTTWDVDAGFWWSGKSFGNGPDAYTGQGGGSYAGNTTLDKIKAANPKAVVIGYGVGLGTYNEVTYANANLVTFRAWHGAITPSCHVTTWTAPAASSSSASGSASATASSSSSKPPTSSSSSASASATASSTATASASSTPAPVFNAGNRLPTTGSSTIPLIAATGVALLLVGTAIVVWLYRRNRYVTEA